MYRVTPTGASLFWQNYDNISESYSSFVKLPYFLKFAQNGFYFVPSKNVIRCFSCCLEIRNWEDIRSPLMIHVLEKPNCEFIHGETLLAAPVHRLRHVSRKPRPLIQRDI